MGVEYGHQVVHGQTIDTEDRDGAAAMIGRYQGFSAYLKKAVHIVVCVDCVAHRQDLVAKNLAGRQLEALGHVIKAVNLIKNSALKDRLFQQLCEKNNEELEQFMLHTEVRWLSKAAISTELLDDDLAVYVDHLKQLHNNMETRFSDLLQMTVSHWFVDPFSADLSEVDVPLKKVSLNFRITQQLKQGSSVEDTTSCG
ncbi:protein FAM200C-like [Palaemon carinicauda]|uniref:protein FAM200C-like n=1 Tax=Palaemon carinicauda TaxID=392227 RepID=UPI0035B6654A